MSVDFLNDEYGGLGADRNLYVSTATINSLTVGNPSLTMLSDGAQSFTFFNGHSNTPIINGFDSDTLQLEISEDTYGGEDAKFSVSIDGKEAYLGTASPTQSQLLDLNANFAIGSTHTVAVDFLNDAYQGIGGLDRNLYVTNTTLDGVAVQNGTLSLLSNGMQSFSFVVPPATVHSA